MNAELDYDLSPEQWQALKALRTSATQRRVSNQSVLEQLVVLGLAAIGAEGPQITSMGRKVLIRGSSCLWEDVAA
jgi:hypothetical protein